MKAAVLYQTGTPLVIEDLSLGDPGPDEVRIRVAASGLCHSDYHFMSGDLPHPLPVVLGHEAAGIVEAVGSAVCTLKPGDHVVSCMSAFCGGCPQCMGGHNYRCDSKPARSGMPERSALRLGNQPVYPFGQLGGFAEEMVVNVNAVTRVPREMPLDRAATLGCAVLTGYGAAVYKAQVRPGETVVVIGCGGVGLNVIQGARAAGAARIIAVDIAATKLDLARRFGATDAIHSNDDVVATIIELTKGGVDHVFEVIGLPGTIRQGFLMLRKGGQLTLIGVPRFDASLDFPALPFMQKEVRVTGSLMGSVPFSLAIPKLANEYLAGRLQLDELISRRISLQDINLGYKALIAGEEARTVIVFDDVLRAAAA
ncbi:S-(hydroxymethyl)glutathione dehydrogenase/alcohol dehydrogenase [Pseudomonas sp. JAI111]|uniref:Zn-dependent alcohol dehydrogenase n=1 Tax=Pseudomonas sp. JAI111 TaxID=2735913 RepID=UPI00216920D5|nr:Zn-dependent alcohol dehydrogenase [Pseudomonas sp. JAI111]MCS3835691.1 S-(hydroxymethyl)glutathione dehydrogenase/alcohol dehydrogenase [Pseudomonas sp. JAI111]